MPRLGIESGTSGNNDITMTTTPSVHGLTLVVLSSLSLLVLTYKTRSVDFSQKMRVVVTSNRLAKETTPAATKRRDDEGGGTRV